MVSYHSKISKIKCITDFDLQSQRVFLRLDLNVPIKDQKIIDDSRIIATLPTIEYALKQRAKLIVASHLGRPHLKKDKKKLSLMPIADYLAEKLNIEVLLMEDVLGEAPRHLIQGLHFNQILMLENLRFNPGEEQNALTLATHFASYTDIYINDAFAVCHRSHASLVGLPTIVKKKGVGFLVQKEMKLLDSLFQAPSPFTVILGGAKLDDKLGVIQHLIDQADIFIIGGLMAYAFLKAQGVDVGDMPVQNDQIQTIKDILKHLEARSKTCLLPIDHVICSKATQDITSEVSINTKITKDSVIPPKYFAYDLGPQTIEKYKSVIAKSQTIFWNGPMGLFEVPTFAKGTFEIAQAIAHGKAYCIVGGGDSLSAVKKSNSCIKNLSTGGGASLKYLQGQSLPGLKVLETH